MDIKSRLILKQQSSSTSRLPVIMMKLIVVLALCGLASAQLGRPSAPRPATRTGEIINLRSEFENEGNGNFHYLFENDDGTNVAAKGYLKPAPPGEEFPIQVQEGHFEYYSPEGDKTRTEYSADERGFLANGAHLPTSPPIPEEILKTLGIHYANADAQVKRAQPQQAPQPKRFRN